MDRAPEIGNSPGEKLDERRTPELGDDELKATTGGLYATITLMGQVLVIAEHL